MNESLRCRFLDKKYIGEKLNMENKVRYKLHKVKKQWVTLAVASVALATIVGASVTTSSLVSAEEINNTMDHLQQLQSGKIQILWLKKR